MLVLGSQSFLHFCLVPGATLMACIHRLFFSGGTKNSVFSQLMAVQLTKQQFLGSEQTQNKCSESVPSDLSQR